MISNERPSPYGRQPYGSPQPFHPKPHVHEDTLLTSEVMVERKCFVLVLRENPRGRFLRIIEESGGRPSVSVIVPSTGLKEFQNILNQMVKANEEIPQKNDQRNTL